MKKGISSNLKEIVVYLFVGGLTTVISWVSYALFEMLFSGVIANSVMLASVANVLSWIIAVAFAFITNKLWEPSLRQGLQPVAWNGSVFRL